MTQQEIRNWYEHQIEWYGKVIGWCNREIEYLTRELEQNRKDDREMVEYVSRKEDASEWEKETFAKGYQGTETHKNLLARRREYLRRKKANKEIKKYEKLLAAM